MRLGHSLIATDSIFPEEQESTEVGVLKKSLDSILGCVDPTSATFMRVTVPITAAFKGLTVSHAMQKVCDGADKECID